MVGNDYVVYVCVYVRVLVYVCVLISLVIAYWLIQLRFPFTISVKSLSLCFVDFLFLAICKPLEIKIPDWRQ